MLTKSKLAIAAAVILGAASAAQAASENPSDPTRGFPYGPEGQRVGGKAVNPIHHLSTRHEVKGSHGYASARHVPRKVKTDTNKAKTDTDSDAK
jgi:hypothetical protein